MHQFIAKDEARDLMGSDDSEADDAKNDADRSGVLSSEEFVNVAWDSAGVTTGPVTVPLVLAMGLGLGKAVSATEGFGILFKYLFHH